MWSEDVRDLAAREILITAALFVAALFAAMFLRNATEGIPVTSLFCLLLAVRWVVWAVQRAAARPARHRYFGRLVVLTALGLLLVDLGILVDGFRSGAGPNQRQWAVAIPLGTLAFFLLQQAARAHTAQRQAPVDETPAT